MSLKLKDLRSLLVFFFIVLMFINVVHLDYDNLWHEENRSFLLGFVSNVLFVIALMLSAKKEYKDFVLNKAKKIRV